MMDFFIRVLVGICLARREIGIHERVTICKDIFELINITQVHLLEAGSYSLSMFHNSFCVIDFELLHSQFHASYLCVLLLIKAFYKSVYYYELVQVQHSDKVCV